MSTPATSPSPQPSRQEIDTLCYAAGDQHNIALVRELLDTYGAAIVNARSHYAATPLMYAANWGHTEAVALLLERGADISLKSDEGKTVLMYAAWNTGKSDTVLLLLERGAALDEKSDADETALSIAREQKMDEIAALLERGAEIQYPHSPQFLKDTDFSKGLEKPIPKPRPFKIPKPGA